MKQTALRLASAVVIFAALLLLWVAVVKLFNIPVYMLPTPDRVLQAAIDRFSSLMTSLWITGAAAAGGLAAAIIDGPCRITDGGSCGRPDFQPTQPHSSYDCRYAIIDKTGTPVSSLRFDDALDFSEGLAAVRLGRQWGYADRSGQISIAPQFESAEPFSEGLAAVRQNGKTGFIDPSGSFAIPPQFQSAESFSDGRALIAETSGARATIYRFIDRTGKEAFPGRFAAATSFSYGLAQVAPTGRSNKTYAWIDTSGRPVFTYAPVP